MIIAARPRPLPEGVGDPVPVLVEALRRAIAEAARRGLDESMRVVDPALGFNRLRQPPWYVWDARVLAGLCGLRAWGARCWSAPPGRAS